ncbi:hypothetical protein ABT267_44850, partial [Nonomuraea sp. NPDC001023]
MHRVAVIAVPPATTFDLSIPELVLGEMTVDGRPGYDVRICTAEPGPVVTGGSLHVTVPHGLEIVEDADTVIVTGTGARDDVDPRVLRALRRDDNVLAAEREPWLAIDPKPLAGDPG